MPSGMAQTSWRCSRRARRKASQVYNRSPSSTPAAVPGTMRPRTISGGRWNTPIRIPDIPTTSAMLSMARAKNPLMSPRANQW